MFKGQEPALFVIVGHTPGGDFAVPAASARVAAQVVRHLTEYCPHTRASWQVNPHARSGPVVVLGGARASNDEQRLDQDAHAFPLDAGDPLPSVWIALCGHRVAGMEFDALDPGTGRSCRDCHQRQTNPHHQRDVLPVRSPGQHMHPQLRHPTPDHRVPGGANST
ncbi:MAG: hypothetical protein ACRDRY_06950 [Pseudonocardiaceae bacterium]